MSLHQNTDPIVSPGVVYQQVPKDTGEHQVDVSGSGSATLHYLPPANEIESQDFDLSSLPESRWRAGANNTIDLSTGAGDKKLCLRISAIRVTTDVGNEVRISSGDN